MTLKLVIEFNMKPELIYIVEKNKFSFKRIDIRLNKYFMIII